MSLDSGSPPARSLVLGLGCERGTPAPEVIALAEAAIAAAHACATEFACISSLDTRAGEPAILAAAAHFRVPLRVFDAVTLEAETPRLVNPSDIVFAHTGCHGVAEAAALAAAGMHGVLIVPKTKSDHATAAIAEFYQHPEQASSEYDSTSSRSNPGHLPMSRGAS